MTPTSLPTNCSQLSKSPTRRASDALPQVDCRRINAVFQDAIELCRNQRNLSFQKVNYYQIKLDESLNELDKLGELDEHLHAVAKARFTYYEYHRVDACAQFIYYATMHNFLISKQEEIQTSNNTHIPVARNLNCNLTDLSITNLIKQLNKQNQQIRKIAELKRSILINYESTNLEAFELNIRLIYHYQIYYKIQSILAGLYFQNACQSASLLFTSSVNNLKPSENIQTAETAPVPNSAPPKKKISWQKNPGKRRSRARPKVHKFVHTSSPAAPAAQVAKESSLSKTVKKTDKCARSYCKELIKNGICNRKDCRFAHKLDDIPMPQRVRKRNCAYGDNCCNLTRCSFRHSKKEIEIFNRIIKQRQM